VYSYSESDRMWLSLGAGYTFRRRKRLQPYLGLYLGSRFYEDSNLYQGIFRRSDSALDSKLISNQKKSGEFGDIFFFAQAGLHYQLTECISLGLEIIPGIGVGGRYRF